LQVQLLKNNSYTHYPLHTNKKTKLLSRFDFVFISFHGFCRFSVTTFFAAFTVNLNSQIDESKLVF
jgi:hypothetical protein